MNQKNQSSDFFITIAVFTLLSFLALPLSAATISGRVLFDKERTANPPGTMTGIANVPVVLQNTMNIEILAVLTDANGNFAFTNVPDGDYQVMEAYGTPGAVPTPGNYLNAVTGLVLAATVPPISSAFNPPPGATHLDCLSPNTVAVTIVSNMSVTNLFILNGPVKYTPIDTDKDVDWNVNLITAADNGSFGAFPAGTPANTSVPSAPYPTVIPDYAYVLTAPGIFVPDADEYTVQNLLTNTQSTTIGAWWRIADRTSGNETGRMAVVNGDVRGMVFFTQTVTVAENTDYLFGAWILNLFKTMGWMDPAMGVTVKNSSDQVIIQKTLGDLIPANTTYPEWKQIGTVIHSGNNTSLTVQLTSEGPQAMGNDFAIDDVFFYKIIPSDLTISGGTPGTDYTYTGGVLTIIQYGTYTIGMASGVTTTTDHIVVSPGIMANITLNGVNIDVNGTSGACAFDMTGATVYLTLEGDNTLKSGTNRAGLQVPMGAMLTIGGAGSLTAIGGYQGAGIGSGYSDKGGYITINSGTITATGGECGAGIGGGDGSGIDYIIITGGTVYATGGLGGANIGQGRLFLAEGAGFTSITYPTNATISESATATFSVTVVITGTTPPTPTYQWQISTDNGATWNNVSDGAGGTTADYTTATATIAMNGYLYRCIITALNVNGNGTGTIIWFSNPAILTVDDTPPTVTNVTPASTSAAISGNVVITFSEPMNTATAGTVQLNSLPALTGGAWSNGNTVFTVPYSGLSYSTTYTVNISGFADAAGNTMIPDAINSFTTTTAPPATYTLTVINGTGGGSFAAGVSVTITANTAPAGQVFNGWTSTGGGSFADAAATTTTFTMPAGNATVTATYRNVSPPTYYTISIGTFTGGRVVADRMSALAGETVTLTITPDAGDKLVFLIIDGRDARPCVSTSGECNFIMPDHNVTVTAVFENPTLQAAWLSAKALIEANTFTLTQQEAPDANIARYHLAELVKALIKNTGFSITYNDIVIFSFTPANAGTVQTRTGNASVNGSFEFRVTPSGITTSAYSSGIIIASPVGNEEVAGQARNDLRGWVHNGVLYVSGLTPGEKWSIYNIFGTLVYTAKATDVMVEIPLSERGFYIIRSSNGVVKINIPVH